MSELSYKELQEQGVFDVPYRAFEYMQYQQTKIDELEKKYDAMYNAFIVADDFRKEWHESYMIARKERDELQAKYDELNNRATGIALDQMTTAKLNYELQGRIDEAMDYIADSGGVNTTSEIALNHILKGNKDD